MNENAKIKIKSFREFSFILCLQYIITAYLMNTIYQTNIGIGIVRQIIIGIISIVINAAIGIFIQNGTVPKKVQGEFRKDNFREVFFNIAVYIFIFSLLNDLIAWNRIFTTLLAIINKSNFIELLNKFKKFKVTTIINPPIGDDKSFHIIIWTSTIIGLAIVNLYWLIGIITYKPDTEEKTVVIENETVDN